MSRDPDMINPDWKRANDWPYEEDWDSHAWKRRMAESNKRVAQARKEYGFAKCPKCGTEHTGLTLSCRECEYKARP